MHNRRAVHLGRRDPSLLGGLAGPLLGGGSDSNSPPAPARSANPPTTPTQPSPPSQGGLLDAVVGGAVSAVGTVADSAVSAVSNVADSAVPPVVNAAENVVTGVAEPAVSNAVHVVNNVLSGGNSQSPSNPTAAPAQPSSPSPQGNPLGAVLGDLGSAASGAASGVASVVGDVLSGGNSPPQPDNPPSPTQPAQPTPPPQTQTTPPLINVPGASAIDSIPVVGPIVSSGGNGNSQPLPAPPADPPIVSIPPIAPPPDQQPPSSGGGGGDGQPPPAPPADPPIVSIPPIAPPPDQQPPSSGNGGGDSQPINTGPSGGSSGDGSGDSPSPPSDPSGSSQPLDPGPVSVGGSTVNPTGAGLPAASPSGSNTQSASSAETQRAQDFGNTEPLIGVAQNPPVVTTINGTPTTITPTASSTILTSTARSSRPGSSTSGTNGSSTNSTGSGSSSNPHSGSHGMSTSLIAAISVIIILVLSALAIFCCIYRSRRRNRQAGRKAWWRSASYGATDEKDQTSLSTGRATAGGVASARSSFATTFDVGLTPTHEGAPPIPTLDLSSINLLGSAERLPTPMSEVHHAPLSARGGDYTSERSKEYEYSPPRIAIDNPFSDYAAPTPPFNSRFSTTSHGSDKEDQYLIVPTGLGNDEATSPMSVRPFSPSESWSFPKPPSKDSRPNTATSPPSGSPHETRESVDDNGDKRDSAAWLYRSPSPILKSASQRTLTPTAPEVNASTTSVSVVSAVTAPTSPPSVVEQNPFADPAPNADTASLAPSTMTEFAPVETIKRPFEPTLPDEVRVLPGETVRVIKAFDDGWAIVEKVPAPYKGKNKARESVASGEIPVGGGLIPIDCLRGTGEDLPAFLASKRVSSYSAQGMAL